MVQDFFSHQKVVREKWKLETTDKSEGKCWILIPLYRIQLPFQNEINLTQPTSTESSTT